MATYTYFVSNVGSQAYQFSGISSNNPTLTFNRGDTVVFNVVAVGHPFWIKTQASTGTSNSYNNGVTNNGTDDGTITFVIPDDSPFALFYQCQHHGLMNGLINIQSPATSTTTTTTTDVPDDTATTTTTTTNTPDDTATTTTTTTATTVAPTTTTTAPPIVITTTTVAPDDDGTGTTTTTLPPVPSVTNTTFLPNNYSGGNLSVRSSFFPESYFGEFASNISSVDVVWSVKGSTNTLTKTFFPEDYYVYKFVFMNFLSVNINGDYSFAPNITYDLYFVYHHIDGTSISSDSVEILLLDLNTTTTATPTTTTTDSPLDTIIDRTQLSDCPCGSVILPSGGKDGLKLLIKENNKEYHTNFIHTSEVEISNEQKFVTITETIKEHIKPKDMALYIDIDTFYRLTVENVISINIKEYNTKKVIAHVLYGAYNSKTKSRRSDFIDKPSIHISGVDDIDLYDNALIFEINSICEYNENPCCDSLPTSIRLFGANLICLPLEEYYNPDDINPVIITTRPPEEVIFTQQLGAASTEVAGEVLLFTTVESTYNSDIMYQVEILGSSCTNRLHPPKTVKSGEQIRYIDDTLGVNNVYRIFISSPSQRYSTTLSITNTTTTTPEPVDPEINTTYTTAPPPPVPSLLNLNYDFDNDEWSLLWDLKQGIEDLSNIGILYRYNDSSSWNNWLEFKYSPSDTEWSLLTTGSGLHPPVSTEDCAKYQFKIRVYANQFKYSDSDVKDFITAQSPSAPINLSAVKSSNTGVVDLNVSWSAPVYNGECSTLSYEVDYRESGSQTYTSAGSLVSSTSISISNRDGAKEYFVRVRAVNTWSMYGPYETTDPYSQLLLQMENVYEDTVNNIFYTPDSSSYNRLVKCHIGYLDQPLVPSTYFGTDAQFGNSSFDTNLPVCPADYGLDSDGQEVGKALSYSSDQFGNTEIVINDGVYNKFTVEFWLKVPTFGTITRGTLFSCQGDEEGLYSATSAGGIQLEIYLEHDGNFVDNPTGVNVRMNSSHSWDDGTGEESTYAKSMTPIVNELLFSISDHDWHHIAVTVDGELNNATDNGYYKVFLDGNLEYNTARTWFLYSDSLPPVESYHDHPNILNVIGIGRHALAEYDGLYDVACFYVDEFRIASNTMYCSNFTVPTSPLNIISEDPC